MTDPSTVEWHERACEEAGCHDYSDPVVIRHGAHVLHASADGVVVVCRRCGAASYGGWVLESDL